MMTCSRRIMRSGLLLCLKIKDSICSSSRSNRVCSIHNKGVENSESSRSLVTSWKNPLTEWIKVNRAILSSLPVFKRGGKDETHERISSNKYRLGLERKVA
jgi:hypothetical protein